jgi:tetratricopeptide (TPR) repeat protein
MAKPPRLNPILLAQFEAAVRRLELERAAAEKTVDRLLRDTPRDSWKALADHPDLQTAGALERLAKLVTLHVNRDARYALSLADLAVAVAERLPANLYQPVVIDQLRAHALKDLGKVRRTLAHHEQAIDNFVRAESLLVPLGALAHDLALVRLHLAFIYQEVDRFNESFEILRECRRVFTEHGDKRMVLITGIAEGALLQRLGKFREAREAYLLLLVSEKPDLESEAALRKNIALCCIELGDFAAAELNLAESSRLYQMELGQPVEALKAQTAYGRLLIRSGSIERGITQLKPIRRAFLGQGMAEEAGICALEIIEGMLARHKFAEAERLARMVVHEFTRAKLNKRAITALGYLSRALAAKRASTPLVRNVREYILSLRTNPEREFLQLATVWGPGSGQ